MTAAADDDSYNFLKSVRESGASCIQGQVDTLSLVSICDDIWHSASCRAQTSTSAILCVRRAHVEQRILKLNKIKTILDELNKDSGFYKQFIDSIKLSELSGMSVFVLQFCVD